jgi:hypothetical protein
VRGFAPHRYLLTEKVVANYIALAASTSAKVL